MATAPRVSKVASYSGVTIFSFRAGTSSGVGDGDAAACEFGVALDRAWTVGEAVGELLCETLTFAFTLAFACWGGLTGG